MESNNPSGKPVSLSSDWGSLHQLAYENRCFFENDKRKYISRKIYQDYTSNFDIIPNLNLNVTEFLVVQKAGFYESPIIETRDGNVSFEKLVDVDSLADSLGECAIDYTLNRVGIIRIVTGIQKIKFENVLPHDCIWDYNLENVIVRLKPTSAKGDSNYYLYEWYQLKGDYYHRIEFLASKECKFYSQMFSDDVSEFMIDKSKPIVFKVLPICFLFGTTSRIPIKSNFADVDLIMNMLLGFGLANVPSSLLVKIFIKTGTSRISPNKADLEEQFGDILAILGLNTDEAVGKVDTGNLEALVNFFLILEKVLVHVAQLEGIQRSSFTMAQQTRQSGVAKLADNRASGAYRNYQNRKLNKFETEIFQKINTLLSSDIKFKHIDKTEFTSWTSAELLDHLVHAVSNGFEDYVSAVAKFKKIPIADAEAYVDLILKNIREKYSQVSIEQHTEAKKVDGVYKGYLKSTPNPNIKQTEGDDGI